jgi:hypothetical protein
MFRNLFTSTVRELNSLVVLSEREVFEELDPHIQDALVHIHTELVELRHKLNAEIREVEYRSRPPKSPGHPPGQP